MMTEEENVYKVIKQIKEDKYEQLVKELKTKDNSRILHAIEELVELGDERTEDPLSYLLSEELDKIECLPRLERLDKYIQYYSAEKEELMIVKIDKAIDKVATGCYDYVATAWEMDRMVIGTFNKLSKKEEEKAIDVIIEIIEMEQPEENKEYVRYSALETLGVMGGMTVETLLVDYVLKEEEDKERSAEAACVLTRRGGEYTTVKMQEILEYKLAWNMALRLNAIMILGKVYHPRSREVLEKLLKEQQMYEEKKAIHESIKLLKRKEEKRS